MILKHTQPHKNTKTIYGFDIETTGQKNTFYSATVYKNDNQYWYFTDKHELIDFFKTKRFKHSIVAATNLSFDFFGTFHDTDELLQFQTLFRGSDLISAKTVVENKQFKRHAYNTRKSNALVFLDTLNYAKQSVAQLGKILDIPKLEQPACLGRLPTTDQEAEELKTYNIQDAKISKEYINFLYETLEQLGATPKATIASSAMSLFKNKYIKDALYFQPSQETLVEHFNAYYGGRTETFNRGRFKRFHYYDFNSLYPSVMCQTYPDPNSMRTSHNNSTKYFEYEGISKVTVHLDWLQRPLLPYVYEHKGERKLIFPVGTFTGWYTHVELRKAIDVGYTIQHVYKTYYFKRTCEPFKEYVEDLYKMRLEYKEAGNPMQQVVKLLLNSLYGKFGQKFLDKDNWIPLPNSVKEIEKLSFIERIGNFVRIKEDAHPAPHCIPIWATYTTAYGRLKLFDAITKHDAYYCDTDSIVTKDEDVPITSALGGLKREYDIHQALLVKPKMYGFEGVDVEKQKPVKRVVAKGIGTRLAYNEFIDLLNNPTISYQKFFKFKEAMRRGFIPNEMTGITKNLVLEDTKRAWQSSFSPLERQYSEPIRIL